MPDANQIAQQVAQFPDSKQLDFMRTLILDLMDWNEQTDIEDLYIKLHQVTEQHSAKE